MFDEADLYLPAVRQPASKEPMEHLLRRARSAGLGLLLATQSPGDFDYRCRDNIRTWFVGQVKETNSLAKMKPMLSECRVDVAARLPGQTTGQFHLIRDGVVTSLMADPSAVDPRQIPEDEILSLARAHLAALRWHAANFRLTRVFFPIGFVAVVRAAIDARMATAAMAANEVLARVAERRVLRPAGFHRSYRQRLFVEHDLGKSSGSAVDAARRAGYPWTEQIARKMLRNVEKTRSSSSPQRSEPAALRGQGGNEHGGSPWFKGGSSRAGPPQGRGVSR